MAGYSHKKAMAAVKRGHGSGKTKAVGKATGNTTTYPSSNSGPPYNQVSAPGATQPSRFNGKKGK